MFVTKNYNEHRRIRPETKPEHQPAEQRTKVPALRKSQYLKAAKKKIHSTTDGKPLVEESIQI